MALESREEAPSLAGSAVEWLWVLPYSTWDLPCWVTGSLLYLRQNWPCNLERTPLLQETQTGHPQLGCLENVFMSDFASSFPKYQDHCITETSRSLHYRESLFTHQMFFFTSGEDFRSCKMMWNWHKCEQDSSLLIFITKRDLGVCFTRLRGQENEILQKKICKY